MEKDFENKPQANENDQHVEKMDDNLTSGEGYRKVYRPVGARPQRPRIQTQRPYSATGNNVAEEEGGFRPEGFGSGLQGGSSSYGQKNYRPRFNSYNNNNGGYQQRGEYNNRGGYTSRNNNYGYRNDNNYRTRNTDGGYQFRNSQDGFQPNNPEGYQPRNNQEGYQGRQHQEGYTPRTQQGYRPRYNQGEEQGSANGYQPRGYNNNRNNYNNRGYNQGYNQGGYRQQGGYNQGGGYRQNNNRGGYGQGRGGYNQRGGYRHRTPDYDPNAKYSLKKRIIYNEEHIDPTVPLRLNKFLANAGVCSRREADQFIQAGKVKVNGEVVTELGTKVLRTDNILFNDQPIILEKKVYVLVNKPKDCVTTSDDPQQRRTVMDLVKNVCPERIYPVGRLDRNTTGVLLLTNDGDLASKLAHPQYLKKKVYHVFLDKEVKPEDIQKIAEGITLEDGEIHADSIEYADERDKTQVGIEIHSGKNRIVRRIFEALGYHVVKLDRVQFAGLTKKNLRRGDWRFLTEREVNMLRMGAFE